MIFDKVFGTTRDENQMQRVSAAVLFLIGVSLAGVPVSDELQNVFLDKETVVHEWAAKECTATFTNKAGLTQAGDNLVISIPRAEFEACVESVKANRASTIEFAGYGGLGLMALGGLMGADALYFRRRKESGFEP